MWPGYRPEVSAPSHCVQSFARRVHKGKNNRALWVTSFLQRPLWRLQMNGWWGRTKARYGWRGPDLHTLMEHPLFTTQSFPQLVLWGFYWIGIDYIISHEWATQLSVPFPSPLSNPEVGSPENWLPSLQNSKRFQTWLKGLLVHNSSIFLYLYSTKEITRVCWMLARGGKWTQARVYIPYCISKYIIYTCL